MRGSGVDGCVVDSVGGDPVAKGVVIIDAVDAGVDDVTIEIQPTLMLTT